MMKNIAIETVFSRCLVACLLCGLAFQGAWAQGADSVRGEFRLISMTRISSPLYYFDGSEYREARTRLNRFSESYRFEFSAEWDGRLQFFTTNQGSASSPAVEGIPPAYRPLGEVAIPRSGSFILLLTPVAEAEGTAASVRALQIALMPDVFAQAGQEGWLFVNLSERTILARVGQDAAPIRLERQSQQMVDVKDMREFDLVQFAARIDGEPQIFYSTAWPAYQDSSYVVFFSDREDGSISVVRIAGEAVRRSENSNQ